MPAATQTLLDDAAVNIDQWIADEVETAFAEQEGAAFVNGDGVKKPKGFLDLPRSPSGLDLGQDRLRRRPALPAHSGRRPVRHAGRPRLCAEGRLPPERRFRDEPQDPERHPQVQGRDGNYLWPPPARRRPARDADGLSGGRGRGHAGHRRRRSLASPSATSAAAISWWTAPACACCAIPIRPSPTSCSTRRSASAAACRTSTPSSS